MNHDIVFAPAVDRIRQRAASHKSPKDRLHEQFTGNCSQCQSQDKCTPATFDHAKHIELDREYDNCVECHRNANKHDIRGGFGNAEGGRGARRIAAVAACSSPFLQPIGRKTA